MLMKDEKFTVVAVKEPKVMSLTPGQGILLKGIDKKTAKAVMSY